MPAKKKARWTTAQKNAAKKKAVTKGPKKPYHRGQAPSDAPRSKERWRDREDAPAGERPKRVRRDGTEDRGQRTWERREDRGGRPRRDRDDRGGYQRRDDRSDDRGGYQRRDDRDDRGGYQRRERDDRGFQRRDDRGDRRRGATPRFEREQQQRGFAPRTEQVEDPDVLRQEADTWTSSART